MTPGSRHVLFRLLLFVLVIFQTTDSSGQKPPDTALEREPYPESRGLGSDILAVPQFIIDIPVNLLEGATGFLIEDLYGGLLATQIAALVGNFDRVWGFYPVFSTGSRSGFEYGLGFRSKGVFTEEERLKVKGSYSAHDYQNFKIQYRAPNFIHPDLGVTFLGQYRQRPWESFHGLGNNSSEQNQVNYNPEHSHLGVGALWTLNDNWKTDFDVRFDAYNISNGEDPGLEGNLNDIIAKFQLSPGEVRGTRLVSLGATVDHDWRDHAGQPTSGGRELVGISYYKSTRDYDDFAFWRTSVDIRHYLELFRKRTMALRILLETVDLSGSSTNLPFYLKNSLGGVDNLRGYRSGRFLDNDLMLVSLEYRYPILEIIDGFVFLDEGRVFNNLSSDFKWHDWKYSYGIGLRVFNEEDILVRTFLAKSEEDSRFYLEFSDAF